MCDHCGLYNEFPPIVIGGPGGDYQVACPVLSCKYAEYRVLTVTCGDGGAANIVITGDDKPIALPYDASKTLNDDTFIRGQAYRISKSNTTVIFSPWARITHSQKRIFARIDTFDSCYITLQFRVRLLDVIPAPSETIHPDLGHQMNIDRSERIELKLARAGIPERAIEHVRR